MKEKIPVMIFGSGAVSREAAYLIEEINMQSQEEKYEILGFVGEIQLQVGQKLGKYPILCTDDEFKEKAKGYSCLGVVIPMGNSQIKKKIYDKIKDFPHLYFPNLIHPKVNIRNLTLGMGNIIQENVSISIEGKMGNFNLINYAAFLGHDVEIGDFTVVGPQAKICGSVKLENECFIGVGATVLQNLSIGKNAVVGAGAVVIENIILGQTVVGVPARAKRKAEKNIDT